ncbi:MAG: SPOR domain-containing protein [Ottowia sp.]|nr:SPOR domain-containing protein [Ottowia sp.]
MGLLIAVVVAFYILRAPTPTLTKNVSTAPLSKEADPNALLYGKSIDANTGDTDIPDAATETLVPTPAPTNPSASGTTTKSVPTPVTRNNDAGTKPPTYILQIAAYTTRDEAERQRAQLAIQGYEANVSEHLTRGVKYYRVRLGPFHSLNDAEKTREDLLASKIDTLLIKQQTGRPEGEN